MSGKVAAGFVIFRIISNEIQYLMLQTSYGEHHWTPPKGHVDPGETDVLVTALRETREESGLTEKDLKIFKDAKQVLHYYVRGRPKTVTYWLAQLIDLSSRITLSHEHQDYKWLGLEDACEYGQHDDIRKALKFFDEYIKKNII